MIAITMGKIAVCVGLRVLLFMSLLTQSLIICGADRIVTATNYTFNPPEVRILVGESVTWTNAGGSHNIASTTGLFRNDISADPWQLRFTFNTPGTFAYVCQQHQNGGYGIPRMVGSVQVRSSNAPPTIEVASPQPGAVYAANDIKTLAVNATDDGLISQVEFFVGDLSLGIVRASPFVLTVPLTPGSFSLVAKASDDNGSITSSEAVHFEVSSNNRPTISLTSPPADTHIVHPYPVTLKVQIADEEGSLAKVEYFNVPSENQVTLVGTVFSEPFDLPAAQIDFGVARIIAVVTDTGGLSSTSAPVRFFFSDRLRLTHVRDQPGWFTFRTSPTFSTIILQISTDLSGTNWVDQGTGSYPGGGMIQSAVPLSGPRMFIRAKVK